MVRQIVGKGGPSRLGWATLLLLSAMLVVSGCGGSSSSSPSTSEGGPASESQPASESEPTTGAAKEPSSAGASVVKVGVVAAVTGAEGAFNQPGAYAAEGWAKYMQENPIPGHEIQLVVKDSKSEVATALAAAKELVEKEHVAAMMVLTSGAEPSIASFLAEKAVPLIGVGYSEEVYSGKLDNTFGTSSSTASGAPALMAAGKHAGATKLGVFVCAEAPVCKEAAPFYAEAAEAAGLEYGATVPVSASAPDYTAPCLAMIEKNVNYIYLGVENATGVRAAEDCVAQGYEGIFGAANGTFSAAEYGKLSGVKFVGPLNGFPWWAKGSGVEAFRNAMEAEGHGEATEVSTATATWSSLMLLAKATEGVKGSGEVSAEELTAGYHTIKDESLEGLLPKTTTFAAGTPAAAPPCGWLFEFEGGDSEPQLLPVEGKSGNGQSGELATTCFG